MIPCSMRGIECSCPPDQCVSAPVKRIADEPPVISFGWRDLAATVAFGLVMMGMALVSLSAANEQFRKQDLIAQEVTRHG